MGVGGEERRGPRGCLWLAQQGVVTRVTEKRRGSGGASRGARGLDRKGGARSLVWQQFEPPENVLVARRGGSWGQSVEIREGPSHGGWLKPWQWATQGPSPLLG